MGSEIRVPGLNIQYPWSKLIIDGQKTVETRRYPLPKKYVNQRLALIETPGSKGKALFSSARIVALITFSECYQYKTKDQWLSEYHLHCVEPDDLSFSFDSKKETWGWKISSIELIPAQSPPKRRGIKYASSCTLRI